jgi:DNA-3-methyladenine glycosylase I
VATLSEDNVHCVYHDTEYGYPINSDNELFGRLVLEMNQAGLSWTTILNKKDNFRKAYDNWDISKVAAYGEEDVERLKNDAGIIRNRLKIAAAIHNAQEIVKLQEKHGSFMNWLDMNHPMTREEWVKLFKKTFKFTGGEITNEFLMSSGYLEGAHIGGCKVHQKILALKPRWSSV